MKITREFIILLLQIIKHNGNVNNLISEEFSYTQLFNTLDKLEKRNYIELHDSTFVLTDKGEEYLKYLNKKLSRKGLYRYMSPKLEFKKKKMGINEIFVPLQYKRE